MPKKKYSKKGPILKRQGWRQLRRKNRIKRKLRLFSFALIIFISGTMFYGLLKVWDYFANPKAEASYTIDIKSPLSTKDSMAVFVAQKMPDSQGNWILVNPRLLVVNKPLKKAVTFTLPTDLKINAGNLGEISLTGFGRLFQAEWEAVNPLTFLENTLKIPIEGIFLTESEFADFSSFSLLYQSRGPGSEGTITNLNIAQLIDLAIFLKGLLSSDIQELAWDRSFAISRLERDTFLKESLRLEFVNGSGSAGLASQEAEKISSLGIKISSLRNFDTQDEEYAGKREINVLILADKVYKELETVKYLVYRYNAAVIYQKDLKYPASLIIFNEP
ncbi:MAG: hypothetical protein ABH814_03630 [bacterium]